MCEKLYDVDAKLQLVPQLAAALPERLDGRQDGHDPAARGRQVQRRHPVRRRSAVKTTLDRHRTLQGVRPRSELAPSSSVEVVDPTTVELDLTHAVRAADRPARRPRRA